MSEKNYPSDDLERFQLRLPPGMRGVLGKIARENNRSMNSEILERLKSSLEGEAKQPKFNDADPLGAIVLATQEAIKLLSSVPESLLSLRFGNTVHEQAGLYSIISIQESDKHFLDKVRLLTAEQQRALQGFLNALLPEK